MAVHVLERSTRPRARRTELTWLGRLRHLDAVLIATTFLLTGVGLVLVYTATRSLAVSEGLSPRYYLERQVVYACIGVVVMLVCMLVDYRRIEEWGYGLYAAVVLSLVVVIGIGRSTFGAQRWISLGPIELQPSEFGVLGLIIAIACYVSRREQALGVPQLLVVLGLTAVPMLLVVAQPDLGTGIVMGVSLAMMLVLGGVRMRFLVTLLALVLCGFVAAGSLHLLNGNETSRLTCFLHQDSTSSVYQSCNYTLVQSETAIGAGGLRGTGLGQGQVTSLGYVPVQYADFIFSALGEQLGFFGCTVVLGLFGIIVIRIVRAVQLARDMLGRLLCAGILAFIAFSVFQNVGMNIGIMPITGIPLPFVSYGGSALLAFYAGIGIVNNVEMHRAGLR